VGSPLPCSLHGGKKDFKEYLEERLQGELENVEEIDPG